MFITLPPFEHPLPAFLQQDGCRSWRVVELSLRMPWFLVTLSTALGGERIATDLLLSWEQDMLELIGKRGEQIAALQYMDPPAHNNSRRWKLRQIQRAWLARQGDQPDQLLLEDSDGEFCQPTFGRIEPHTQGRELILDLTGSGGSDTRPFDFHASN